MLEMLKRQKEEPRKTLEVILGEIPDRTDEIGEKEDLEEVVAGFQQSHKEIARLSGEEKKMFQDNFLFRLENAISLIKHNHDYWKDKKKKLIDIRDMVKKSQPKDFQ